MRGAIASSPPGEVAIRRIDGGTGAALRTVEPSRTGPSGPFGATSPKGEGA